MAFMIGVDVVVVIVVVDHEFKVITATMIDSELPD